MRLTTHQALRATLGCGLLALSPAACSNPDDPGCVAEVLEDDAELDPSLGDAGDPANWPTVPEGAVVASTYLRMEGGRKSRVAMGEIIEPILADLMASPGLIGMSFSNSRYCRTTRTLSVWESEEAMMDFVWGDAHATAISRVSEVSRGGTITATWPASRFPELRWDAVVPAFAEHDGPEY